MIVDTHGKDSRPRLCYHQSMKLAPALCLASLACSACPGKGGYPAPSAKDSVKDVVAKLEAARKARTSFRVETLMDYWVGSERAKGTVYVMGTSARQVRFNAIKPGGSVLIDMACDGNNFTYVNFQSNCQLTGPCTKSSIASLLRVELEPEDFHDFAQGTPPLIPDATGTVTWDSKTGKEHVELTGGGATEKLVIDTRDGHFDVLSAELVKDGKLAWSVANTDFTDIEDANHEKQRVPGKTRFKSPGEKTDLIVDWKSDQRAINLPLEAAKFTVPIPEGLPRCGASGATTAGSEASP